jgi:hypothetical protein
MFIVTVSPSIEGWYWEVALEGHAIIARGTAESSIAARMAALKVAIERLIPMLH